MPDGGQGALHFILAWTSDRPHDQIYYRNPPDIIGGKVRVPYIAVDNPHIQRRHINAILLGQFLRYRQSTGTTHWRTIGTFYGADNIDDRHIDHLAPWLQDNQIQIAEMLSRFPLPTHTRDVMEWVEDFRQDVMVAYDRYSALAEQYKVRFDALFEAARTDFTRYRRELDYYDRLRKRLRGERLIDYLSSKGVLPSYSFPIYVVELHLPPDLPGTRELRLQRDLKLALREYAPDSEVIADKRIWRSDGVQFYQDTVREQEYRICETCNRLQISEGPGIPLEDTCPVCESRAKAGRRRAPKFIIPDGFFAMRRNNGKAAGQYVRIEQNLMKSALFPSESSKMAQISPLVQCSYDRDGKLLYVNEGDVRFGAHGFYIRLDGDDRGRHVKTRIERSGMTPVSLGHERETDTLHLQFLCQQHSANLSFWTSLMYAIIHGSSRALQIERTDIDGVLFPRRIDDSGNWQQTIVLYDDVPGGAGHVKQIRKEFATVVETAVNIANCDDCAPETSCYSCLRDYSNQRFHHILRRDDLLKYLEKLRNSFVSQTV